MKKFLVLYMAPFGELEKWKQMPAEKRAADEKKMQSEWQEWMKSHAAMLTGGTAGVGSTKKITREGISDTHNDLMLYSIAEAESSEAVSEAFKTHPHFGIPGASVEIMPINPLTGMQ